MESSFRKIVQKKTYDVLSHKYGLILVILGIFGLGISAFHFGEAMLEWSSEKYAAVFNSYSDNIAGRSYRQRLCLPVPIDVVYTWVNGTDESLVHELINVKRDIEIELNITREEQCTFRNCIPAAVAVLDPQLSRLPTLSQFLELYPAFSEAAAIFNIESEEKEDKLNVTVVAFRNVTHVKGVLSPRMEVLGQNVSVSKGFYTSDATVHGGVLLKDTILMSGFPHQYTDEQIIGKLPHPVEKIELVSASGVAVLHVPKKEHFDNLVNLKNFSMEGKEPTMSAAKLVWNLRDFSRDEDIAASRFEDNEELRYSLRSVEKYAPWVRHVYIVTNGQIPYWLDLECPRVSVVTHEEIFPNISHLPTYSSPAIESHLHRIPGISDKFIYLNDDVMFGSEVWPDDFYSHATGQKVYLTWPVPNCNDGCPSTWIKDGYCDKACNTSECDWDAGDCDGDNGRMQYGAGYQGGFGDSSLQAQAYCNTGCANNWIADKYCDTACNIKKCGFDAGDCGTKSYDQLYQILLSFNKTQYSLPPGEFTGFFNLTDIVKDDGTITDASYNDSKIIRQVAVGNKYKVMTVILQHGYNDTTLNFYLKGHQGASSPFTFNFSLSANTNSTMTATYEKSSRRRESNSSDPTLQSSEEEEEDDMVIIQEVPQELQQPEAGTEAVHVPVVAPPVGFDRNFTNMSIPDIIQEELGQLNKDLSQGDLTEKGFQLRWHMLYAKYLRVKDDPTYWKSKMNAADNGTLNNEQEAVAKSLRKLLAIPSEWRNIETFQIFNESLQEEPVISRFHIEEIINGEKEAQRYHNEAGNDSEAGRYESEANDGNEVRRYESEAEGESESEEFLAKVKVGQIQEVGGLPWEKKNKLTDLQLRREEMLRAREFQTPSQAGRRLLDTFGDSLRHVNKLYNKAFGFVARKVPAHMPHMVDKHVMGELQEMFPKEWDVTSSHKVRHSKDMQYAFSYFYYLMGVTMEIKVADVFAEMDTDHSRSLSDRELRTFAARLYDLPLYLETLQGLEQIFVNCSNHLNDSEKLELPPPPEEQYYDKAMPQVTRKLFLNCGGIEKVIKEKFKPKPKYKFTTVDDSEVTFYMIRTNVSSVVGQLDNVRKHPKKFVCLNDNIEHGTEEAKTVKAVLQDFYESLYPIQSQFELARDYRNRFLHTRELREWRRYRDWLKFWTHLALVILVIFTIVSFFGDKIEAAHKRLSRRANQEESVNKSAIESSASSSQSKESPLLPV